MAGKRKPEIRILTLFLAMVLAMTSFSSVPVYAAEKTAAYTTEEKSETLQVLEEEAENSQEDAGEKEPEKIPEAEEAETIQLEDPDLENKENENGQEEPRAPTEAVPDAAEMPDNSAAVMTETEEIPENAISVSGEGTWMEFQFDQLSYTSGDTVTAVLTPETGYDIQPDSIKVADMQGMEVEYELSGPDEKGSFILIFQAAETDMLITAEAVPREQYAVTVTTESLEEGASVFETSVEPMEFYEGTEVTVHVEYSGDQIWTATVTFGEENTDLDFQVSSSAVTFTMPAADVEVVLSEREGQNLGDLSAADDNIAGDWQGNTSSTKKEHEPDVELSKSARWTDIEDGYAELTITEKDTSDYSNIPVDYIIILDRTRTMSLSGMTWEQGGYPDIVNENSPCINPDHYYHKGGISLSLVDYYTGFDHSSGYWFNDLSGGASSWTKRHYNGAEQNIGVSYGNGCQDRLTMARQAIYELMDQIEEDNASVPDGKIKSRVAFWSFADGTYYGAADSYRLRGLFNYTPWTEDYGAVKTAVSQVKTFSGTYYTESLKEAYRMITERNRTDSAHADVYTKVIFISDGVCGDPDWNTVRSYANQIKSLPNTDLFTLAIGMPSGSEGAAFLAELATQKPDGTYTANFWQNLSFSGGTGSALAETLFSINGKAGELSAGDKVLTDQIETKYWEPVEIVSADGGTDAAVLDKATGKLTWRVPEGAGQTYRCTVRLKLKDEYRYLLSDTSYPTNRDGEEAASDLTKAGAVMSYTIQGGIYNQENRKTGVVTPKLKYGTAAFSGEKHWTVSGSRADSIMVKLMRTLPSQSTAVQVNNAVTNAGRGWAYSFSVRLMPDGSTKPLIKYDENGRTVQYEVTETVPEYYTKLDNVVSSGKPDENGGSVTDVQLYNEPFKVKAQLKKVDEETGNPLSGAVFGVYAWSERAEEYVPYRGTTDTSSKPYETGSMTGAAEGMTLTETEKGVYLTPSWLWYSPDNQGKFRIIEISAPEGYFGDWKEELSVTENSTDADKNVYDFSISPDRAQNGSTILISNQPDGTFGDQRVLGKISFTKEDLEAEESVPQGDAHLNGAVYRLYAAEDILHPDQSGTVLHKKGEEIRVSYVGAENGVRTYQYDPEGIAVMETGSGCTIVVEGLELGSYYLKEEEASEGYLVDPKQYSFELTWQGEKVPEVEISGYPVYEQVKKQTLTFYKVTGTDNADRLDPLEGAKFSVYLVSDLAEGSFAEVSDEELPQAVMDAYRDPTTLDYAAFRQLQPAIVFDEADSEDVKSGRLKKSVTYSDGTRYDISDYTDNENAYFVAELESDAKGIVTTPKLPYGRYVVIETTVPENRIATRPFVIHVQEDGEDGTVDGDGQGKPLEDLVLLMDRPVTALVRIEKVDSQSKKPVLKEGASYLICDVDGAWFDYYTQEMTTAQKNAYKEKYGDLVVQYSQGVYLGTEDHPYTTKLIPAEEDETANVYIETPQELPAGTYELQEISAPEGYVLQGHEGVIAKDESLKTRNKTYYETEESGRWKETPQGVTRFVVSSGEAVYDSSIGAYLVTARQQNDPAVGKISIYAEGEKLVSAAQEGSTILTRLGDALSRFFGYVKGLIGLDVPDEQGMTEAELSEYRDYVFAYELQPIEGAQFEIRAAEGIYSPEGGANAECLFTEGELVMTLTTDAEGKTWTGQEDWEGTEVAKGLPLGKYTVTQVSAGEGFALSEENAKPREIEIAYAGQEIPVIYRDTSYTNPRQKVKIAIEKQDQETGTPLAGAVFGLYAAEDIQNYKGKTVVKEGTLLATAETTVQTDESGKERVQSAIFAPDLPLGQYYVKELKAPFGYASGNTRIDVDASWQSDQREALTFMDTVKNAPIRVQINLMDYYTEVELDGAQLTVLDEEGNPFTTFLTVHEGNPVIQGLETGKTYTLKELVSREGYHRNLYIREDFETSKEGTELDKTYAEESGVVSDSIRFTVLDTKEMQIVSVFNKPLLGELTIEKTGEEAVATTSTTDEDGNLLETPVYEIKGLPGAEYALRVKEDIVYPDGYTGTLFEAGAVVLDEYADMKESGISSSGSQELILKNYELAIVDNTGELADVSGYLGVKHEKDASQEEIKAFYQKHGSHTERQIPSEEEIKANETRFGGTPVIWVLRTNEEGLVKLTGLPTGEYEVIEVKAPVGYYRDKTACIQSVHVEASGELSGQPEETVTVEVKYENAKQEIETPPEQPEKSETMEVIYHPTVEVTKHADKDLYEPGETVAYQIAVTNTGDVDLSNVRVDDSLAGGQIKVIDSLAVGDTKEFSYEYVIPEDALPGSRIDNTVQAIGTPVIPDPGTDIYGQPVTVDPSSYTEPEDSDLEKVFVRGGEILVKKAAGERVYRPGETAVYTIEVLNPGTQELKNVQVKDSLGGSFVLTKAQEETEGIRVKEDGSLTIDTLAAGGKTVLRYEYEIPKDAKAGTVENLVIAEGETDDPEKPVRDEDEEIILVRDPDITITKKADRQVYRPGETAHYTIVVTNTGNCGLTDVTVEEQLLTNGGFVSSTKGTFSGAIAQIGGLAIGESVTLTFDYVIPEDEKAGTALKNIVTVQGIAEPAVDPAVPELPDGTPNYLPKQPVSDRDEEIVYVETVPAGMAVVKYSLDEGIRSVQAGAEFTLYAEEEVKNLHGAVIYEKGQEIETAVSGENGIARFETDVPVGRYRIAETKAPAGHYSSGKEIIFEVNKAEHNDNVHYLSFRDYVENAVTAVRIRLVDDMTGNELADASLQITDPAGNPIQAWITRADGGYVVKGLEPDTQYTITENVPRTGYLVNFTGVSAVSGNAVLGEPQGTQVSFMLSDVRTEVTEDGKADKTSIPETTEIILENPFITGEVQVNKDGEVLESWTLTDKLGTLVKSVFRYGRKALSGVEFTVTAAEDIYHPDGVTGLVFRKGDIVVEKVRGIQSPAVKQTDSLGIAGFTGLYPGSYEITETAALNGYIRDAEPRAFTLAWVDGYTDPVPAAEGILEWTNPRQKIRIEVMKTDLETGETLSGALIGLYTEEDIQNGKGDVIVRKGTLLESSETGEDGQAVFESDLPFGYRYAVQELAAPEGYRLSEERPGFDFDENAEKGETAKVSLQIKDQPDDVRIEVEKSAPEIVKEQESFWYVIEKVRNAGNCTVDNFTLTDMLPEQVILTELRTGAFTGQKDADSYSIWYQTNQNETYRLWKDHIPADTEQRLLTEELGLEEGEEVTAFQYRFGTVNKGFTELDKPEYLVEVKDGLTDGEEIRNQIEVTGEKFEITYTAEDETVTIVKKPGDSSEDSQDPDPTRLISVRTGDSALPCLWILTALTATIAGVIIYRKVNKKKEKD